MMNGKQKLYFLLDAIENARVLAPSGQPLKIHATHDLNNKYRGIELDQLFTKLVKDEKIIKLIKTGNRIKEVGYRYGLNGPDDGSWHIKLLPAFDNYFIKIQNEPEYQEFTGKIAPIKKTNVKTDLSLLHKEIFSKCQSLFEKAEYPEAVEKSFKIVRELLKIHMTNTIKH